MLRSLINRSSVWSPAPEASIGIVVGKFAVTIACADGRSPHAVKWLRAAPAPEGIYSGSPKVEQERALGHALAQAIGEIGGRYVAVHVALPDPVGAFAVFEVDNIPGNRSLRDQLVRWRMAKEFGLEPVALEVRSQDLGGDSGKRLLLGQALPAAWLTFVRETLQRAGVTAWSINQAVCFRFNRYQSELVKDGQSGAMLALDADAWTALIWDAAARPRYVRSVWRSADAGDRDAEADAIAAEFERMVLAYAHATGRLVERVCISADANDGERLAAFLDRRLRAPSARLALSRTQEATRNAALAVAVAGGLM